MKVAKLIRKLDGYRGDARLYAVEPPMSLDNGWDEDTKGKTTDFVVVSGVDAMFTGPETYIFASDDQGEVSNWSELNGSFRGSIDHEEALRRAGYEVVP